MDIIDLGEPAPITTKWWQEDGTPVEPSAIAVTVTKPDGTVVTKAKADMTGAASPGQVVLDVWALPLIADVEGLWRIHAVATVGSDTTIPMDFMFLVGLSASELVGPCEPWCTWDEVTLCGPNAPADVSSEQQQLWIDQASEILWNLTGRFYSGICQATRSLCFSCWGCRPAACGCDPLNGVDLGGGRIPVWGAWDVTVAGELLDPSTYRIQNRRWLVRTDDTVGWPTGALSAEDPNAFRVSWAYGRPIPQGARLAAARFALQIALRCTGSKECQLPSRVTTVVREGVTFTVLDSMKMIAEGRTGLDTVDLWVIADRKGRRAKPGLFSPAAARSTGSRMQ